VSILTLDVAGSSLTVACQRGGHAIPRQMGQKLPSGAGELTQRVRAELMVVPVVLIDYTPSTVAAIRTLFANGAQVPCAGDVFNNGGATVTCSGDVTDEFEPAGPWFGASLTLYEVGTSLGYNASGGSTTFKLTDTPSDQGGGQLTADPDGSPWGQCFRVLDAATPATCGSGTCAVTYSLTPERKWLTEPLAAGTMTGTPVAIFASKGINGAQGIDIQSTKAIMYQVRGGADVAQWETGYQPGAWAGGPLVLTFPSNLLVTIQSGDRLRIELWGRLALSAGASDPQPYVLARQTICYPGELVIGGTVVPL
jgi:hypothetical protein